MQDVEQAWPLTPATYRSTIRSTLNRQITRRPSRNRSASPDRSREREHGGGEQGERVERRAVEHDVQRLAAEDEQPLDAGVRVEQ